MGVVERAVTQGSVTREPRGDRRGGGGAGSTPGGPVAAKRSRRSDRPNRSNPLLADPLDVNPPSRERDSQPGTKRRPKPIAAPSRPAERASAPEDEGPSDPERDDSERAASHGVVCTVGLCPICTLVVAFGEARPELTEHLLLAGREVLLALKVLIDARLQDEDASGSSPTGLEHIKVD